MVNSISYPGPKVPDMAPKAAGGAGGGAPATADIPTQKSEQAPAAEAPKPVAKVVAPQVVGQHLAASGPMFTPPFTSLALYKDAASGLQVSVVRDRVSGEVVERVPTERALRLATMVRQQEALAQELQQKGSDSPRLDLKT